MNKNALIIFLLFLISNSLLMAEDVTGFWCTFDKKTHLPTSVIAIYPYQGNYYGRIVATYNKQGSIEETIHYPKTRATGMSGNPYYCGLDIVWVSSSENRGKFTGHVIDPQSGKVYAAKLWAENGALILRGELMMFGRNETLYPFPAHNFGAYFEKPDTTTFVPVVHRVKN